MCHFHHVRMMEGAMLMQSHAGAVSSDHDEQEDAIQVTCQLNQANALESAFLV